MEPKMPRTHLTSDGADGGFNARNPNYHMMHPPTTQKQNAYVKIIEQPASRGLRFRYECEGRLAGAVSGINSTAENKTYPAIEIVGYKGRAVVIVSCVSKDPPYRPHPNSIVGKKGCKNGVCTVKINSDPMRAEFTHIGIQCVKRKDIETALKIREEIRVDPFKTGFEHRHHPTRIDTSAVRLCFQVFTECAQTGRFTNPLPPVVSDPIYDKKIEYDLVICRLCRCSATVMGNSQLILLCKKIAKDNIAVRFFEEANGQTIWEAFADFQQTDVHKQTSITIKTPKYRKIDITEPAKVFIQLKRPSDGATSEPLPFEYIPLESDPVYLKRKRQKTNGDLQNFLLQVEANEHQRDAYQNCQPTQQRDMSAFNASTMIPATMGNKQLPPQQHRYNTTNLNGGNINYGNTKLQMEYHIDHNNFFGAAGSTYWEQKIDAPSPAEANDLNNANNENNYPMQNTVTTVNYVGASGNGTNGFGTKWNINFNDFNHQQQEQHQHLQQEQQYPILNDGGVATNNCVAMHATNTNNSGNCFSNFLNFDSNQLVPINSEDIQMVHLNSEDLRISDLILSIQ